MHEHGGDGPISRRQPTIEGAEVPRRPARPTPEVYRRRRRIVAGVAASTLIVAAVVAYGIYDLSEPVGSAATPKSPAMFESELSDFGPIDDSPFPSTSELPAPLVTASTAPKSSSKTLPRPETHSKVTKTKHRHHVTQSGWYGTEVRSGEGIGDATIATLEADSLPLSLFQPTENRIIDLRANRSAFLKGTYHELSKGVKLTLPLEHASNLALFRHDLAAQLAYDKLQARKAYLETQAAKQLKQKKKALATHHPKQSHAYNNGGTTIPTPAKPFTGGATAGVN